MMEWPTSSVCRSAAWTICQLFISLLWNEAPSWRDTATLFFREEGQGKLFCFPALTGYGRGNCFWRFSWGFWFFIAVLTKCQGKRVVSSLLSNKAAVSDGKTESLLIVQHYCHWLQFVPLLLWSDTLSLIWYTADRSHSLRQNPGSDWLSVFMPLQPGRLLHRKSSRCSTLL